MAGKKRLRQHGQAKKNLYGYQGPRDPAGYEGPKNDENNIFSEWVPLVGKMIPHLIRVFWAHLGPPSCHIGQKSKFPDFCLFHVFSSFFSLTPIGPLKGPVYGTIVFLRDVGVPTKSFPWLATG